ncbi:MAG: biosynthetic-type acetolactate synthase large subunit [Deltaproteobacteria bacterium]|jgi:acetolactate synthase I/II/III large subunit|nr:biosynthetic-type acetolactate synthase large subunit [Deltaproteobacteria bacterium]MBT4527459.1 biosynthetic-type acetolactate synthase large subunit [Deltaproteobacteria bacterium]
MSDKVQKIQEITGAKALVKLLKTKKVDTIFGYPGGANLPIYEELRKSGINHILSRHEQGAIHMADGYARVKKKPGVCLATSGPGATNLVTGLANAMLDSVPIVALTGQIPSNMIGTDAFQEVDCINITMPVTKHNELVLHAEDLVPAIKSAFHIANSGRKGPVLLDFPKDVLNKKFAHNFQSEINLPGYNPTIKGNVGQIKRAIKTLKKAKQPVVLFGGGIYLSNAINEFLKFIRLAQIPVVRTLMGTGIIAEDDPLYIGMIGTHGNTIANRVVNKEADVVFAIGTRLGDRSIMKTHLFAKNAKIIHLDIDPAEIGKTIPIDIPIVGDIKEVLADVIQRLEEKNLGLETPWKINNNKRTLLSIRDAAPVMQTIFNELSNIDQNIHVSTDVGRHQMWANHYCTNPKHLPLITSGGLGTMGFGLPAAIGAWFADPDTPVVSLSGDGSFMMNMQEFIVAVENQIPLTVIILNDYRLGMIRELQTSFYNGHYTTHNFSEHVSFTKFAEAMGGKGFDVKSTEKIGSTIRKAVQSRVPTIIDFDLENISKSALLSLNSVAS